MAVPDDALLRPTSVNAIARRISLPYETARRAITRLNAGGWIDRQPGGYISPAHVSLRPPMLETVSALAVLTEDILRRLAASPPSASATRTSLYGRQRDPLSRPQPITDRPYSF